LPHFEQDLAFPEVFDQVRKKRGEKSGEEKTPPPYNRTSKLKQV
jgi:hypothetical protein